MQHVRLAGPGSGAEKYDILTALAVKGLAASGVMQTSVLRLMALVTARYNWARDEVTIGQREMAQLWSVDERTAKRETKRLLAAGFLRLKRPGVKGRVAAYSLDMGALYRQTEDLWDRVGPDFVERMAARHAVPVPPPDRPAVAPPRPAEAPDGPWGRALRLLEDSQPAHFASWFSRLTVAAHHEDELTLRAPSPFAAQYIATHLMKELDACVRACFGASCRCKVVGNG